ncbi:MAG: dihydropteroate synthase [Bacteriovorax sp.]|nr:dihydropteroate synthase [Bacteriovorax sp.]
MGVINITPNSFSDPKLYLNTDTLIKTLNKFLANSSLAFDFGFESTAPMNQAISLIDERARFDLFFEQVKELDFSGHWISFDTYKPQNFLYFEEQFKSRYNNCGFIFNDVSGVLDEEVIALLKSKKNQENFYYIFSSTHIPKRENVLKHMLYLETRDIIESSFESFTNGFEKLNAIGFKDKIIFDPCFGFSKSYDQNWELLNRFDELLKNLELQNITVPWLIGISKKSFLRQSLSEAVDPTRDLYKDSELIHAEIISDLISKKLGHLIFRVHEPDVVTSVECKIYIKDL